MIGTDSREEVDKPREDQSYHRWDGWAGPQGRGGSASSRAEQRMHPHPSFGDRGLQSWGTLSRE